MQLRLLASDDTKCHDIKTCPAIRADDAAQIGYVTGKKVTDPTLRAELGIGPDEDAVAIPLRLLGDL
jgi:hypothetical protein